MKTTIGGDRLGSGSKQNVSMKSYNRSTHDLSYLWRSSMASGTLVPFMSEVGLPGDSFDINLNCEVLTLPTVGPLFGSYKVQLDVFSVPIRLYNGKLHMNKLGIGMDMSAIKLPQLVLRAFRGNSFPLNDNAQVNSSCLLSYLNIRGVGKSELDTAINREFTALSYLGYWDIYKQYYANKQEDEGVVINTAPNEASDYSTQITTANDGQGSIYDLSDVLGHTFQLNSTTSISIQLKNGFGVPNWNEVQLFDMGGPTYFQLDDLLSNQGTFSVTAEGDSLVGKWENFTNKTGQWRVDPQQITATVEPSLQSAPNLLRFPLENIDTMREDILKAVSDVDAFKISGTSLSPYGLAFNNNGILKLVSAMFNQQSLAIKTYQSDLFNNWISTEWIDGTNGINEITSVDTTGDSFTIDSLNLANKVYDMLNRIAISGGTYDDWLDAVYTHERARSVENPVYMGSLIKELSFEEVVSTADTGADAGNQPLGTLAGRGKLTGKNKGGRIKVKVDEPSIIMGIVSLTPRVDYSQGNKWDVNLKTMNDFHKPALDAIGYQDLITDQMAWFDTTVVGEGNEPTFMSAGKQPAWINYMTNVNQVRGNFAEKNNSMFMVLNRRYESGENGIEDLTTYVDPSKFNHIFADTRLDAQNFWVQISNNITARRKMSAKVIPNL